MDARPRTIDGGPGRRRTLGGWLAIVPILLIILLMLAISGTASAARVPQAQNPTCQSCHPSQYDVWKNSPHAGASLDPLFQEQLARAHNQESCLACHASGMLEGGVQAASGKVMADGVTCEACHGAYQAGHPAQTTMKLPMESTATCRTCHEAAFSGWEKSKHAEKNIECFDCHLAHSQGVRTGSVDKLCAACHSDQVTQAAHSRHGINGVNCTDCHMGKQMTFTATGGLGTEILASSHSFLVAADVCSGCHASATHTTGGGKAPGALRVSATASGEAQPATTDEKVLTELRTQISELHQRLTSLRNAAVISLGLAAGVGGFMGLVVGLVGTSIWKWNRRGE